MHRLFRVHRNQNTPPPAETPPAATPPVAETATEITETAIIATAAAQNAVEQATAEITAQMEQAQRLESLERETQGTRADVASLAGLLTENLTVMRDLLNRPEVAQAVADEAEQEQQQEQQAAEEFNQTPRKRTGILSRLLSG